jgi:alkanesulfonate monooxygenase SsuD/methylene tetrahydromethanopterin reductase-like flavin-dependent oxidoreductase (luciferase family)
VKVSLWNPVEYAAEGLPEGWPAPGRLWSPERGSESLDRAFELFDLAVDAGFDMVSVAEHHCGYGSLTPSPIVMAAALAQRYADVEIGILGPILPLAQPLRVAEEIAMVDLLSGGRTLVGFFRGIPNEFLAFGTAPAEGAEMLREAVELVVAAWTEPEPFGWEGRHYRHRSISVWPRPLQSPHPPVLLGATSPESASWAAVRACLP